MRSDAQPSHLSHEPFRVVVLVSADGLLVGTAEDCCHLLGGIPLTGARSLCDAAIDDQVMTVVHQDVSPVAQLRWMGIGFMGQQCLGIGSGTVGLVAELHTAKVALGSFLPLFGSTETFARSSGWRRRVLLAIDPFQGSV
ncbi:MAG: hypothetical protein RLZZ117_2425 [Cyanobacteriota bacterium]